MENFKQLKDDMNVHSLSSYPREAVGIITKDFKYIPCNNLSNNPTTTFFLDPAALVTHDKNIWGIFHSHPGDENPIPSSEDKISAAFNEYNFLVGFNNKFFIYWYDKGVDALKFDKFKEEHLVN
jgi:proteasome lid subunit RPN8/RPN11|tara:strand:- start:487 stop:858 length:372 start_codon:yes stop_codon:yes gene_type:complete